MVLNKDILDAAKHYLADKPISAQRREYIEGLIQQYKNACELSTMNYEDERPQVAARRAHWHGVADEHRHKLCLSINYAGSYCCR